MSNSTIKEVFKVKATNNNSSKNPKWYNEQKNILIEKGASSEIDSVRSYFATSPHTPTKVLVDRLKVEQDKTILRQVIMNDKLPRKVMATFINSTDERVEWFQDDQEMIDHFDRSE